MAEPSSRIESFLPWVKATAVFVGQISTSGMDGGDGWIALALGAAAIALGLDSRSGLRSSVGTCGAILIAVGVGGLTLIEYLEVADRMEEAALASARAARPSALQGMPDERVTNNPQPDARNRWNTAGRTSSRAALAKLAAISSLV